jgi:hypothetical protein
VATSDWQSSSTPQTASYEAKPKLEVEKVKEIALFEDATFQPLSVVDHPRFVNNVHFMSVFGSMSGFFR